MPVKREKTTVSKPIKFKKPLIYLITTGEATAENFNRQKEQILKIIKAAVEAGISLIQIREKNLTARLLFELAREAVLVTKNTETKLLVNDRADIALAAGADGVHLTSVSIPTNIIRRNFPEIFIIGVSAHSLEKAGTAKEQGADFVIFSPIFSTPNKGEPKGLENLRQVCKSLKPFPVVALGGIDENNYRDILETGASGFAAIRFLNKTDNLKKITKELR